MINREDRFILRNLARQVREIASGNRNKEYRMIWQQHNDLSYKRPLIVVFPEGSWREIITMKQLQCEGDEARKIEYDLRKRIFYHDEIKDDAVIEGSLKVHKHIKGLPDCEINLNIDWGVPLKRKECTNADGAFGFSPVLNDHLSLDGFRYPEIEYLEKETLAELEEKQDIFGDILDVQLKGIEFISFHIMYYYSAYRGLENMMYDFYDEPEFMHALINFFTEGYQKIIDECLKQELFSLNNTGVYQGSGGFGNTNDLPGKEFDGTHIRLCDLWASAEAQETSSVSPEQVEEFVMSYERRLLSQFGLTAYGCCEGLHDKLGSVFQLKNIRRISVSPFAKVKECAEQIRDKAIYSWKPNPIYLSSPEFEEQKIRDYIRRTLSVTKENNCIVEMILADTHTCHNETGRFKRWVTILRECISEYY